MLDELEELDDELLEEELLDDEDEPVPLELLDEELLEEDELLELDDELLDELDEEELEPPELPGAEHSFTPPPIRPPKVASLQVNEPDSTL